MVRWEPDSRGRLEQAAMALFDGTGFENTTVAEIAERAGLTERTFFRHFSDKREVLFSGAGVSGAARGRGRERTRLAHADRRRGRGSRRRGRPPGAAGLRASAPGDHRRQRGAARARADQVRVAVRRLADTLRRRGLADPAASLTAEVAIAVFRTAFERWIDEANGRPLPEIMRDSFDQLKAQVGGASAAAGGAERSAPRESLRARTATRSGD